MTIISVIVAAEDHRVFPDKGGATAKAEIAFG